MLTKFQELAGTPSSTSTPDGDDDVYNSPLTHTLSLSISLPFSILFSLTLFLSVCVSLYTIRPGPPPRTFDIDVDVINCNLNKKEYIGTRLE